jgi:hypothetical protein
MKQIRLELLNFRASNGAMQHLPRMRFRFGQNLYLSEGRFKPYLGVYKEPIFQFPESSYSRIHFLDARFFAGWGFEYRRRTMEPAISPEIVIVQKSLNAVVLSCFPFTWRLVKVYSILNTGP